MDAFGVLNEIIDEVYPGLNPILEIKAEWAKQNPNSRNEIRSAIVSTALENGLSLSPEEREQILDLSQVPKPAGFKVSISHTPVAGGFAFTKQEVRGLGFDLEVSSRVSEPIAARVSSERELQAAPGLAHLWVAKEAAFKALQTSPIKTLSQVETSHWIPLKNNFWLFKAQFDETFYGTGISGALNQQHMCLFLL